jgi:2-oxoglutarate ferredoxin oxidoreductase subunit alpha
VLAFNISQLTLESGEAVRPRQQGSAALQEHVDAGARALDVRPRPRSRSIDWLKAKFAKNPDLAEANIAALNAGHAYGETAELAGPMKQHHVARPRPSRGCTAP